ncbi:hypothetical protein [Clostridium sp. JN-9]|uniref:hypothetical protein n=1 Tax=Clostridium sp. JN-9 TaxID=2507159 RepID=UPI000FFE1283|nr:hypothetical protein [Clostridium sp. JN-9]QAT40298.1 hypothetical protein EQM05_08505 [Clostridium sp. JN-9]
MKLKASKIVIIIGLMIISLLLNVFQYIKFKNYKNQCQINADNEFNIAMQYISVGIEKLKTKEIDQTAAIAQLSSGTSKSVTIYPLTSYYKKNPLLKNTLWEFNNNITNKMNIRDVVEKNDLSILLPTLNAVMNNPLSESETKKLDYLVKKYTVIGSTLQ